MADFLITAPDGRQFRVSGANKEGALAALQAQLAKEGQPQASQGDTSMGTAFSVGNANAEYLGRAGMAAASRAASDGIINDFLTAGREYVGNPIREALGLSPIDTEAVNRAEQERLDREAQRAGQRAEDLVDQTGYRSLQTGDIKGLGSLAQYAGQKVAETAPNMLASIASGGAATIPLMIGEGADATKDLEGLTPEQKADLAVGGGAIMGALENLGIGKLLPRGVSQGLIGAIAKGMVTEGTTEALQELVVIGQEAVAGKQFAPGEITDRLREAGVAGAVVGGTIRTGTAVVDKTTGRSSSSQQDPTPQDRAAASLAQRLQTIATENGWNLRDVSTSSTEGARQTVDNAHVQLAESLKQNFADLREILKPDVRDTLTDIENKVMAQAAYRQGRNKTKNVVGKQEIDALKKLTGDTREGEQALNNIFELNELTKLHNQGYKGGFSQFTDFANPFDNAGNTYNSAAQISNRIIGPMFTTAAAVQTGGASIPAQVAITGAGRTVDALTGRRSRVARYVRNNAKGQGLEAPTMPSLREAARDEDLARQRAKEQAKQQEAAREAQLQQTNRDLGRKGAVPTKKSPQWTMEYVTGLSKNGVARVMRIIEATNNDPIIKEGIAAYRKSIDVGGKVPSLNPLIRAVNEKVDNNPGLEGLRVRQPNRGFQEQQAQETTAAGPYGPTMTTQENYNRGIEENRALLSDLRKQALADKKLSKADKAKIVAALDELSRNLGKDPMAKIGSIMQTLEGVDEAAIDTYVGPYIQRIAGQQGRVSMDQGSPFANDIGGPTYDTLKANEIPQNTRKVFKLMRVMKSRPNEIFPLYAKDPASGKSIGFRMGVWHRAQDASGKSLSIGGKNLAKRPGIHAVGLPVFDQGKAKAKGETRVWVEVEIPAISEETQQESDTSTVLNNGQRQGIKDRLIGPSESYDYKTNPNASVDAGSWPIAGSARVLRVIPDSEIEATLREAGLDHQVENSMTGIDEAQASALNVRPTERVSFDQNPATPSPADNPNPFNLSNEALAAIMGDLTPTPEEIAQMRAGTFKPKVKRSKEEAVQFLFERFKKAFGRDTQLEYTPENVDLISGMMATEAVRALSNDTNAIGWYDAKLKAAKAVVKLVDPSITETSDNEVAFDFALAVTSNGQAVADNFSYAYEVYQSFKKTGKMPTASWKKGGERNASMVAAFEFFNAYSDARMNMPIQDFLDQDFTVNQLKDWISRFNAVYGTSIGVPSSEGANTVVKGSYILGPKIGQGFYQNIRGNYDPLTMDIWWMRMWNRITGRPFEAEKGLPKSRANVSAAMKNLGSVETKLINESLKALNKRKVPNPEKDGLGFDAFVQDVEKRYQKFYKNYKIENGVNHKKPQFFKSTGTHVKNLKPQLQAQPKGPTEREYMRQVTQAAIEKLKSVGFNIQTADFQALMWYPEKQLFRKLGVAAGRGADNDYLDAAILLAKAKGINDAQIQETLASTGGNGTVDSGTSSSGPDAGLYQGTGRTGREEQGGRISQAFGRPILSDVDKPSTAQAALASPQRQPGVAGVLAQKMQGETVSPPSISSVKQAAAEISEVFTIGKEGSKYEKGIKDIPTALRLAKALDYAVSLFDSQLRLRQAAGTTSRALRGQFSANRNSDNPTKQNVILSLNPSASLADGERLSSLEALTTLLHEISHGIAGGDAETGLFDFNRAYKNAYTSATEVSVGNSFEGAIGRIMQTAVDGKSSSQRMARKMLREVENLQNNLSVHAESSEGNSRAVRGLRRLIEFAERQKTQEELNSPEFRKLMQRTDDHISYVRSIPEFAVDPVWVYLYDPAMAKKVMPETSKVIRQLFQNNKTITFHSHPLAMVVAIFAAILAQQAAGDDEEKKRRQQQPGLLSQGQGQGLLTA